MSQPRVRKGAGGDGAGAGRGRGSAARMSAPAAIANKSRPKEQSQRSPSKNNLPKNVRYDLDNALVGLCDVWFEEIKPHLIRNRIKVHVHEGGAGASAASGDHAPAAASAGCSHLDPGAASDQLPLRDASCVGYCSMPPTASKAQSRRPQAPSCNQLTLSSMLEMQNHLHNYENQSPKRPRTRRRQQTAQVQSPRERCRVPRMCQTNSILSSPRPAPWNAARRIPYQEPCLASGTYHDCYFQATNSRIKARMPSKATQTDSEPKRQFTSVGCQSNPSLLNLRRVRRPTTAIQRSRPMSPVQLESSMRKEGTFRQLPSPVKRAIHTRNLKNLESRSQVLPLPQKNKQPSLHLRRASVSPSRRVLIPEQTDGSYAKIVPDEKRDPKPSDIPPPRPPRQKTDRFGRTPGTTTFFPSRRTVERQPAVAYAQQPHLFQDDLVNLIGEKNDKRLKVLYKKSEAETSQSSMNLQPTPRDCGKDFGDLNKPPWK